jgi:hypothetical protein
LSNLTFKTYFLLFAFLNSRKIYTHKWKFGNYRKVKRTEINTF